MNLEALKPLTLLYIEDEPLIRQNAVEYLGRYCASVLEAADGLEGLEVYEHERPDIIITDIKMPRLNGLAFAARIRETDTTTPIIIATAHTETDYLIRAVELHLITYLVKPITADKLTTALSMACDTLSGETEHRIALNPHTTYDRLNQTLLRDGKIIHLTHNERLLFDHLIQHRQRAVTYAEIEGLIWAYEGMSMDALRSLVRGLRIKLDGEFIENISGVGYRLVVV